MPKVRSFTLNLPEDKPVYFPGEEMNGQVLIRLDQAMEMKEIKIKISGKAHVHWSEGDSKNRRHYSANEKLFDCTVVVFEGASSATGRSELSAGEHVYPFTFRLPSPLPSSYEDCVGYIRYTAKASIIKPWKFDHNTKRAFTVIDILDLNTLPHALTQSNASESKTLCCFCCASRPINGNIYTDRSCYVPGEYVVVNGTIDNQSNSDLKMTSLEIVQRVAYHAIGRTKTSNKTVAQIMFARCPARRSIDFTNEKIQLPPLPPSESAHCKIIDIHYFAQLVGHTRTCAINLRVPAPIVIGTVPLLSLPQYSNTGLPQPEPQLAAATAPPYTSDMAPSQYSVAPPPPTYAAAVGGSVNIKDDDDNNYVMGNLSYTPQYTYYDWNQKAFSYN